MKFALVVLASCLVSCALAREIPTECKNDDLNLKLVHVVSFKLKF